MARKETTVVVKGKGEGWQPLHREVKKTYDAMDPKAVNKGFKQLEHFIGQVTRQVRGLEKGFKDLNQSIRTDRSTDEVKKLREELKRLKEEMDGVDNRRRDNRRGFAMGVLQGAGVGEYFPEKGFAANVGGRVVGRAGRGLAGAAFGGAFSGVGGLAAGLQGIPGVGPFLAGQLQSATGMTGAALQFRQQQQQLGVFGETRQGVIPAIPTSEEQKNAIRDARLDAYTKRFVETLNPNEATFSAIMAEQGETRRQKQLTQTRQDQRAAFLESDPMTLLTAQGPGLGFSPTQALQLGAQLTAAAGGGGLGQFQGGAGAGFLSTALAAQRGFGVDVGVSGQFARAQRNGALIGGRGNAQADLVRAMEQGLQLGLKGSDLQHFMQQTAEGIQRFDQTGIPINNQSLGELGREIQGRGISAVRGTNIARGIQAVGQRIGGAGPQNAADFLVMRDLFGFQGGGADEFFQAMLRAEEGDISQGDFGRLIQSVTGGQRGGAGAMQLLNTFRRAGVNITAREAQGLLADDPEAQKAVQRQMEQRLTPGDVNRRAAEVTAPETRKAAQLEAERIKVGAEVFDAVKNLEEASINGAKTIAAFSNGITAATEQLKTMSESAAEIAGKVAGIIDVLAGWAEERQ